MILFLVYTFSIFFQLLTSLSKYHIAVECLDVFVDNPLFSKISYFDFHNYPRLKAGVEPVNSMKKLLKCLITTTNGTILETLEKL